MYYLLKALLALSIILPLLAILCVALRFYARKNRGVPLLADDWLILVAMVTTIATCAVNFYAVLELGLGQPPPDVPLNLVEPAFKVLYATIIIEYFTYGIIKLSVVLFYKRIFSVGNFALWANIVMALVTAWTIAGIFFFKAQAFASMPITLFWQNVFTINWGALNIVMAVLDLFFDIVILLLPLVAIYQLQVSRAQKLSIVALFWLGFVCVISSAMRIYYNYLYTLLGPDTPLEYFSYVISSTNLWIVIEGNVSIVAACMPTLGGLLKTKVKKWTENGSRPSNYSGPSKIIGRWTNPSSRQNHTTDTAKGPHIKLADVDHRQINDANSDIYQLLPKGDHIRVETTIRTNMELA